MTDYKAKPLPEKIIKVVMGLAEFEGLLFSSDEFEIEKIEQKGTWAKWFIKWHKTTSLPLCYVTGHEIQGELEVKF